MKQKNRLLALLVICATLCTAILCAALFCIKNLAVYAEETVTMPLAEAELDVEDMNLIGEYLDSEIIAEVNESVGSATPEEYLAAYYEAAEAAGLGDETDEAFESVLGVTVR